MQTSIMSQLFVSLKANTIHRRFDESNNKTGVF